jgi:hypothetical protein
MTPHIEPIPNRNACLSGDMRDETYASDEIIERAEDWSQGYALLAPDNESDNLLERTDAPTQRPLTLKKPSRIHVPRHILYPPLKIEQILLWADAYYERTGKWPHAHGGPIPEAAGENWKRVDTALRLGLRGLPGNSTLARLLSEHRGHRTRSTLPPLSEAQILAWADAHHAATGRWPIVTSGEILNASGETWGAINATLVEGLRGLPGGSTLARLLAAQRGVPNRAQLPTLTEEQILAWADAHYKRTGHWPKCNSGYVEDSPLEKWAPLDNALHQGLRGLPGGSTLAKLLLERRGVANNLSTPRLSESQILVWADVYEQQHGRWPSPTSGPIEAAPRETWGKIDNALKIGLRGLPGGSSLKLLQSEGRDQGKQIQSEYIAETNEGPADKTSSTPTLDKSPQARSRPLSIDQILAWADAHYQRTGRWPTTTSGPITDSSSETWPRVSEALYQGSRGLPGGSSLAKLLSEQRGYRNPKTIPPLTETQILAWADAYHDRTGKWPTAKSGPIIEAPGETWMAVAMAISLGRRGLPGGSTLPHLLAEQRGLQHPDATPRLTEEQILVWADDYHATNGKWPISTSGSIAGTSGETWSTVQQTLRVGGRGLPGGLTLAQLLLERRGVVHFRAVPRLSESQILTWALAYRQRHGRWPTTKSGTVDDAPTETWIGINGALTQGTRGLPGRSSLKRLLEQHEMA